MANPNPKWKHLVETQLTTAKRRGMKKKTMNYPYSVHLRLSHDQMNKLLRITKDQNKPHDKLTNNNEIMRFLIDNYDA